MIVEPQSGAFSITTDPEQATAEWMFTLQSADGREAPPETFALGDTVFMGSNQLPGMYTVSLNGRRCGSSLLVEGGTEVLVRVDVAEDGSCRVVVTGRRDLPN